MGSKAPAKVKFQLICDAIRTRENCLSVSLLCQIAGVSRSGFYAWVAAAPARRDRDMKDKADFDLILAAYGFRGYAKGARSIHMRLLHQGSEPLSSYGESVTDEPYGSQHCGARIYNPWAKKGFAHGHYLSVLCNELLLSVYHPGCIYT